MDRTYERTGLLLKRGAVGVGLWFVLQFLLGFVVKYFPTAVKVLYWVSFGFWCLCTMSMFVVAVIYIVMWIERRN
jgi:hypothetical protein